jgi:hypothetical protein
MSGKVTRRNFVKGSILGTATLAAGVSAPAVGAAPSPIKQGSRNTLPKGKIKDLEISRMLLGGNLLTHYTHSRDLQYVYNLAKHYNTDEKMMDTMALAEEHGIDTLSIHNPPQAIAMLKRYRKERGGKMKWIICPTAPIEPGLAKYTEAVQRLIDDGADAIYLWGVHADALVQAGKFDLLGQAVEVARAQGVASGVGGHLLDVVVACEKNKVNADFYIKTLHHHNYPSAKLNYDSMWCSQPAETIEFMKSVKKPWIAFKTMAAGAIPPKSAFQYVLEGGADFVLAGMFDYEIEENVRTLKELLAANPKRDRPWLA